MSRRKTKPDDLTFASDQSWGLTKREYIATQMMTAYVTKYNADSAAKMAVEATNKLIGELNKGEE